MADTSAVSLLDSPALIEAAGSPPKSIAEHVGRASTGAADLSIAHMRSPAGWSEPTQIPEFDEYTIVIAGRVTVDHQGGTVEVRQGQALLAPAGCQVRYRTPGGAEYISVCIPAFSPDLVHRHTRFIAGDG